jgi:hypothetical protein
MTRYKINSFFWILLTAMTPNSNCWGAYYNSVEFNDIIMRLNKDKVGYITVHNKTSGIDHSCEIANWGNSMLTGAGEISLTSDHVGVLIASGNKYLETEDVKNCNGNAISVYSIPYFDQEISTIIDMNFEKKLVLALVVVDAHFRAYQAIVSNFNGRKNIFSGKGFWSDSVKNTDGTFSPGNTLYLGKISPNGRFVAPNDLDCSIDSFPGVWDIAKRKKVIFPSDKDASVIDSKCWELFSGKQSLNELGSKLAP